MLVGSEDPVQVGVSSSYVQVAVGGSGGRRVVAQAALSPADGHTVSIDVDDDEGSVSIDVDGDAVTRLPLPDGGSGGLAIAASDGSVVFSSMRLQAAAQ